MSKTERGLTVIQRVVDPNQQPKYNSALDRAMSMAQYIFTQTPPQEVSEKDAKTRLDELTTKAQSHLTLTTAENVQRIREGKEPY